MAGDKVLQATIRINAQLGNDFQKSFAAGQKVVAAWGDQVAESQKTAGNLSALEGMGERLQKLKADIEKTGKPTEAQTNLLKYLQSEYDRAAESMGMAGKSFDEVSAAAAEANRAFFEQMTAAKSVDELNKSLADVDAVIAAQAEVERLSELYEQMPTKTLKRDLEIQKKALERLKKATGLTGRGMQDLKGQKEALDKALKSRTAENEAIKSAQKYKDALETLGAQVGKVKGALPALQAATGAAFKAIGAAAAAAAGAVGVFVAQTNERLAEVTKRSKQFGVDAGKYQELAYAMKVGGVEADQFSDGMQTLQERMVEAMKEPGEMRDNFKKLGISVKDLKSMKVDQVFEKIAGNIHMLGSEAEITKFGLDMLGGEGGLIASQMAEQGRAGLEKLKAEARATGNVASEETMKTAEAYQKAQHKLGAAWQGFTMQIAAKVMPILAETFDKLTKWVADNQETIDTWAASFGEAIMGARDFVAEMLPKLAELWEYLKENGKTIAIVVGALTALAGLIQVITFISSVVSAVQVLIPVLGALNAVLLANPVILIIAAIVAAVAALAYVIYSNWDKIKPVLDAIWEWCKEAYAAAVAWFSNMIDTVVGFFTGLWEKITGFFAELGAWFEGLPAWFSEKMTAIGDAISGFFEGLIADALSWGSALIDTFVEGITSAPGKVASAVSGFFDDTIGGLLPHSDAERGPFSTLTASGEAIPETMAEGVKKGSAALESGMLSAFNGAAPAQAGGGMGGIVLTINQNIDLSGAGPDAEEAARRGASAGAQDLSRELDRLMRDRARLAM